VTEWQGVKITILSQNFVINGCGISYLLVIVSYFIVANDWEPWLFMRSDIQAYAAALVLWHNLLRLLGLQKSAL